MAVQRIVRVGKDEELLGCCDCLLETLKVVQQEQIGECDCQLSLGGQWGSVIRISGARPNSTSTPASTNNSTTTSHADTSTTPGFHSAPVLADPATNSSTADVAVLRFAAPLFFANGQVFTDRVAQLIAQRDPQLRALVLDMEGITDIDVTGAESLTQALDALSAANVQLAVARLRPGLRARLTKFGLLADVPEFPTNREALIALRRPESSSTAN